MTKNPFHTDDVDRRAIWEMLVDRDIRAFLAVDWSMVEDDFVQEGFMGIDAARQSHPDAWRLNFPDLESYKKEWLSQAKEFKATRWGEDTEAALFRITVLRDIEISGDSALVHKKFFGNIRKENGELAPTNWQTLYRCRKNEAWRRVGSDQLESNPGTRNQ